jgi:hypothetical protein
MTGYALITVIQSETGHFRAGCRRTAALFPAGTAGMSQGQVRGGEFSVEPKQAAEICQLLS